MKKSVPSANPQRKPMAMTSGRFLTSEGIRGAAIARTVG
jgi:hypothetical protein